MFPPTLTYSIGAKYPLLELVILYFIVFQRYNCGSDFMEKAMEVELEKEPDNEYDKEAILVKMKGLGKIGYVANSPFTVKGESMSAGRLYDKISDKAKGKVVFILDDGIVCNIIDTGKDDTNIKENNL